MKPFIESILRLNGAAAANVSEPSAGDLERVLKANSVLMEQNRELNGVLALKEDDYVRQVGTWKIIQRLEEELAKVHSLLDGIEIEKNWTIRKYLEANGVPKEATAYDKLEFLINDFTSMADELQGMHEAAVGEGL